MTVNLDPDEREKFAALAADWWDPAGRSRALHEINPTRLTYINDAVPLKGARVADIGCGGGILSEAMAQAGAEVTALDATPELIEVAAMHAHGQGLSIDYRCELSANLAQTMPGRFDLVTCMELLEHVPDVNALVADCARLLRPRGVCIVSTLNRTPIAYALGVVAAEYVLGLVPRGTHDYTQFIKPSELINCAARHALEVCDVTAMNYNPVLRRASLGGRPRINYLARFSRGPAE